MASWWVPDRSGQRELRSREVDHGFLEYAIRAVVDLPIVVTRRCPVCFQRTIKKYAKEIQVCWGTSHPQDQGLSSVVAARRDARFQSLLPVGE
jgi:hypothetical protein